MKKTTLLKFSMLAIVLFIGIPNMFGQVVISQVYGGGGNSGATLKNDFIELYNRGTSAVTMTGWSLQYASSTGTFNTTTNSYNIPDGTTIQPGKYLLVQAAAGTGGTVSLPTPDLTCSLALSGTNGKIALSNSQDAISNPTEASVVDFVGYGSANQYEGNGPTAVLTNTTAAIRNGDGTIDTNDNSKDFTTGTPNPRNSSYSTNASAAPTFSPAAGNYETAQTVTLSSTTPNAKIYYTLDGSTPDNTKTLYQSPIAVSSNTTIKAIAYDVNGANPSNTISTATYYILVDVANIADLKANSAGFYRLTGEAVLTLKSSSRNVKYVQDATGAILIDDPNGKITTAYNLGDGITGINGTLSTYSGMLQFTPVADPGAASSTGNTVTPQVVTLSDLVNHDAQLVTVNGITINDLATGGNGTFIASKNFPIAGTTTEVIRTVYSDLDYIGQPLPTTPVNVTGVVMTYTSGTTTTMELVPRRLAEIVTTGLISPKAESLKVWTDGGKIQFHATMGEKVEIFNAVGQSLYRALATDGINSVSVENQGVSIVKVGNRIGKVVL